MKPLLRWLGLVFLASVALQAFFVLHIAALAHMEPMAPAPASTTFQRTQIWALRSELQHEWVPSHRISDHLKRAVITAEDDLFIHHNGIHWGAVQRAWERNSRTPQRIRGGSTITQQLAKNLLLSSERTLLRKGQELLLTLALEQFLSKQRILEIYLNQVEWGTGIFGAQAAARHYFHKNASQLTAAEAARLAVMLPAPRHFERNLHSPWLARRTRTIMARMGRSQLP